MPVIPAWEAEAGLPQIGGQPGLHGEFKCSWNYIARLCLKNNLKNKFESLKYHLCFILKLVMGLN